MSACTLDALSLAEVPPFGITVGDICSVCYVAGAPLKVSAFIPVGRGLSLASEHRACQSCEQVCIDAAHANIADQPRHLIRTLALHGHRNHYVGRGQKGKLNPSGVVLAKRVICDTTVSAAA